MNVLELQGLFYRVSEQVYAAQSKPRIFHFMPKVWWTLEVTDMRSAGTAILKNRETKESITLFESQELEDRGVVIHPAHHRGKVSPQNVDIAMDAMLRIMHDKYEEARKKWEGLSALEPFYLDYDNSNTAITNRMEYVISCGYERLGAIRETHVKSEEKGTTEHHSSPEVVEHGVFFNRVEHVPTSSTHQSSTTHHYKYWQEYQLKVK